MYPAEHVWAREMPEVFSHELARTLCRPDRRLRVRPDLDCRHVRDRLGQAKDYRENTDVHVKGANRLVRQNTPLNAE